MVIELAVETGRLFFTHANCEFEQGCGDRVETGRLTTLCYGFDVPLLRFEFGFEPFTSNNLERAMGY